MISYDEESGYGSVISGQNTDRESIISTHLFHPKPYKSENSISITTTKHDDIVTYDNSHLTIDLGDGDDFILPSTGAYLPSIQFGKNAINAMASNKETIIMSLAVRGGANAYRSEAGRPIKSGLDAELIHYGENTSTPQEPKPFSLLNPYKNEGISKMERYAIKTRIETATADRSTIHIGGQKIYGKEGDDIIYGLDPLLYAGIKASEQRSSSNAKGDLEAKFLDNEKTNIQWKQILLSGGEGRDNFHIGALGRINLNNDGGTQGKPLYQILGDRENVVDIKRFKKAFGHEREQDTIHLTATYSFKDDLIYKAITNPFQHDASNTAEDKIKNIHMGANSIAKILAGAAKWPHLLVGIAGIELVVSLGKLLLGKSREQPSTSNFQRSELKRKVVPPGSWNHAITFTDWDPYDQFVINTIPDINIDSIASKRENWENVNFVLSPENNQAAGGAGLALAMQTGITGDSKKTIAYLPGATNTETYGYKTFNFFTDREQNIIPFEDIGYFGVLQESWQEPTERINYTETAYEENINVTRNQSVFLWNSAELDRQGLLNTYRSNAESIQIFVDTRKFGWYTDIQPKDNNFREIDNKKSTFNYWDFRNDTWKEISLHRLNELKRKNPNSDLLKNVDRAQYKYWTAQDTYGDKLMNLRASDAANHNDIDLYKCRDDGAVKDPVTGRFLKPSDDGYQQAALSEENYAGAFSIKHNSDDSIDYIVEKGYKLSPFISTTFENGKVDHIFAYDDVHKGEKGHTQDSMVRIDDSGVIHFEDVIGGDYDYNDAVLDPSLNPQLASHLASALYSNG